MNQVLTLPNLFDEAKASSIPEVLQGLKVIKNYKRLGFVEQIERAKEGIVAAILKTKDMALIGISGAWNSNLNNVSLFRIEVDGRKTSLGNGMWNRCLLRNFKGNIPLEILEKIPTDAPGKAHIFYQAVDPIIAYEIKPIQKEIVYEKKLFKTKTEEIITNYPLYAAVWQWE